MGTFAAGHFLDPRTGRPVAAQTVRVLEYPTDVPVMPDDGPLATGALGGYGRFTVAGVDAVTLVGSNGAQVDLVSIEKQMAAATPTADRGVLTFGTGA